MIQGHGSQSPASSIRFDHRRVLIVAPSPILQLPVAFPTLPALHHTCGTSPCDRAPHVVARVHAPMRLPSQTYHLAPQTCVEGPRSYAIAIANLPFGSASLRSSYAIELHIWSRPAPNAATSKAVGKLFARVSHACLLCIARVSQTCCLRLACYLIRMCYVSCARCMRLAYVLCMCPVRSLAF